MLAGAIRARHHEAMQHGQKHGALDRELEPAPSQELLDHGAATALLPQPLEQQRRADAPTHDIRRTAVRDQRQDHRALRQPCGGSREAIEIAAGLDHFLAAEIADDALLGLAVLANGLDQIQIAVGADSLLAHEHGIGIPHSATKSTKIALKIRLFSTTLLEKICRPKIKSHQINDLRSRGRLTHAETVKVGPQ